MAGSHATAGGAPRLLEPCATEARTAAAAPPLGAAPRDREAWDPTSRVSVACHRLIAEQLSTCSLAGREHSLAPRVTLPRSACMGRGL